MKSKFVFVIAAMIIATAGITEAAVMYDQNVTPDAIFGSGNANGSFTVCQSNGVELGLRGKLRHDATGQAQNIFNSNGDGTYTFNAGIAAGQSSSTAVWSFEWSINSNYDGTSGYNLNDLTYVLTIADEDSFDPINTTYADHSIGTNSTANGQGIEAADAAEYTSLISSNNVAQNSWKPSWFITDFDPTVVKDYVITLAAYDGSCPVACTSITVNVVPEPATIALISLGGLLLRKRK